MLGEPEQILIDGTIFKVEHLTQEVQERFEKYMQAHLLESVKQAKGHVDHEDYMGMLTEHFSAVGSGRYCFLSPKFRSFICDITHLGELLWWCFSKHQEVSKEWVIDWITSHTDDAMELYGRLMGISVLQQPDGSKKK